MELNAETPKKPFKVPKGNKILQSLKAEKYQKRLVIYAPVEICEIPAGETCICISATLVMGTSKKINVEEIKYFLHSDGSGIADLGYRGIRTFEKTGEE